MKRTACAAAIVLLVCAASEGRAQSLTVVPCRAAFGATFGVGDTGDRAAEQTGPSLDAGASFELPISSQWSARADFGTATWTFQDRDAWDVLLGQERVRVDRLTLSAINHGPQPCGAPLRVFVGLGAGVYRYRFQAQHAETMTGGLHGVFGVEVLPAESFAIAGEIGIDAVGGPRRGPVFSTVLWMIRATVSAKLLF